MSSGNFVYNVLDQKVIDGTVNASGSASNAGGQLFRRVQSGKIQQYASLLFAGAAILAGIFIIFV